MGIDIVDVRRFRKAIERRGDRFLQRILTPDEVAYCARYRDPVPHLAARFAAKEALLKALRQLPGALRWREMEVRATKEGPRMLLRGEALKALHRRGFNSVEVSLSHSGDYAIAVVLLGVG